MHTVPCFSSTVPSQSFHRDLNRSEREPRSSCFPSNTILPSPPTHICCSTTICLSDQTACDHVPHIRLLVTARLFCQQGSLPCIVLKILVWPTSYFPWLVKLFWSCPAVWTSWLQQINSYFQSFSWAFP